MLRCTETNLIIPESIGFITSESALPFCDLINRRPFRIPKHLFNKIEKENPIIMNIFINTIENKVES